MCMSSLIAPKLYVSKSISAMSLLTEYFARSCFISHQVVFGQASWPVPLLDDLPVVNYSMLDSYLLDISGRLNAGLLSGQTASIGRRSMAYLSQTELHQNARCCAGCF